MSSKSPRIAQARLPINGRALKPTIPRRSEKALQQQARTALSQVGYQTLETGAPRRHITCPCCGESFTPEGWMGNTPGTPDLLAFRFETHFPPILIPLEEKGPETKVSREQQELSDAGRYPLVRTVEENIRAVLAAEDAMSAYRTPEGHRARILEYLRMNEGRLL